MPCCVTLCHAVSHCVILCHIVLHYHLAPAGPAAAKTKLVRLNDFLFSSNMDNINVFKVS